MIDFDFCYDVVSKAIELLCVLLIIIITQYQKLCCLLKITGNKRLLIINRTYEL
jgi:hypothetical protein